MNPIFTNIFFSNFQLKPNVICFGLLFFEFRSKVFSNKILGNSSSSYEKKYLYWSRQHVSASTATATKEQPTTTDAEEISSIA